MNQILLRFAECGVLLLLLMLLSPVQITAAEPRIQIHSPKDGSHINQEQSSIVITGKVASVLSRSPHVDIMLVVDVSGSTAQSSGVDLEGIDQLPDPHAQGIGMPQITIGGMSVGGRPPVRNLKNSVLAAEILAARRLLLQLDSQTTRVGVVTFSEGAKLAQPLTHDFDQARRTLDEVFQSGPYGGTNMVEGIRTSIAELMGLGSSERRTDAVKVQFLLTDGFPTMPIGGGKRATPQDTHFAINAARLAGKAGIKIHVFALGEEALSYPTAAVAVARESGGTYTPVVRAADVLAVLEKISAVGVDWVQVVNETIGQRASPIRLAADGSFSAAVPVSEGLNRIRVSARASDGSSGRQSVSVYYSPGANRSLDLEVFLERERSLNLEVERLGKSPEQIQREIERRRQDTGTTPAPSPESISID